MPAGSTGNWKAWLACLIVACSLLVMVSANFGHDHATAPAHSCDICHAGHLAGVTAASTARIVPHVIEEWREPLSNNQRREDPACHARSCRAPPV